MTTEPKKPGRKPIGDRPMTEAEKKRRQRSLQKRKEIYLSLSGELLSLIDELAEFYAVDRVELVRDALAFHVNEVAVCTAEARSELDAQLAGHDDVPGDFRRHIYETSIKALMGANARYLATFANDVLKHAAEVARKDGNGGSHADP
jgi:hypothetical protein